MAGVENASFLAAHFAKDRKEWQGGQIACFPYKLGTPDVHNTAKFAVLASHTELTIYICTRETFTTLETCRKKKCP